MHKDLLNILSNSNKDINDQKLMDYVSGKLNESEKHEVERWMAENAFEEEAVEGLQEMGDQVKIEMEVGKLNKELKSMLNKKKQRKERRKLFDNKWALVTLVVLLALITLGWWIIYHLLPRTH